MIILSVICFLAYMVVFVFLWDWSLNNINSCFGFVIPMGWLLLVPATLIQLGLWGFYD